mgnify:CR=1 FL=1
MPRNCWTRCNKTFPCSFPAREKTREIESRETSRCLEKQAILALLRKMIYKFRFVEPSIPYFSTKKHSYIREPDRFTAYRTPICKKPHARHLDGANMGLDISLTYPLFYFTALSNLSSFRFLSMIGTSISANTAASSTGKPIRRGTTRADCRPARTSET